MKSIELLKLVFNIQEKMQKSEIEFEKMKTETNAKFQKIESAYDAMKQDITTINQKIDEGLQRCFEDSEKLIRSTQQQTVSEIRTLNEEVKATSFAEIMKQELEKSLDNMTVEIQTVKSMLSETKTDAAEVRDRENRRNNIVIYRLHESDAQTAEDRKKQDIETCLDLIRNTLEVDCRVEDLKQVFRLGQRNRENNDRQTNIRPILIEFRPYATKNQVMESLYKLKNANAHFQQLSVTHNMTKMKDLKSRKKSRKQNRRKERKRRGNTSGR